MRPYGLHMLDRDREPEVGDLRQGKPRPISIILLQLTSRPRHERARCALPVVELPESSLDRLSCMFLCGGCHVVIPVLDRSLRDPRSVVM